MPTAFITGITGQDGSYLAELLLEKNYEVHGLIRRSSSFNTGRIDHVIDRLTLHHGDITDAGRISGLINDIQPDEIYNLAAQSHVKVSFDSPAYTLETIANGSLNVLEAARQLNRRHNVRVYQASSSEMFGASPPPQDETTPFLPQSPYGCAKVYAYHQARNYRNAYDLFVSNGILFNHESPRRGETFVTRKITRAATRIKLGLQTKLVLGEISTKRDWGFAGDYVEAMWLMLQSDQPDDFVIGTGRMESVGRFIEYVFQQCQMTPYEWVKLNADKYMRPTEVTELCANAKKAEQLLGWRPRTTLAGLASMMVEHDLELARREKAAITVGRT